MFVCLTKTTNKTTLNIATTLHSVFMYCATPALEPRSRTKQTMAVKQFTHLEKTEMEHGHACLLARVTIIAFDGPIILVPLAVIVWANWMKGQVIVGCIYSRISTSKLHKTPT